MRLIYLLIVIMLFFLLTLWAIVDVARKDFGTPKNKIIWWLVASVPFIGFIPYFIFGARKGRKIEE